MDFLEIFNNIYLIIFISVFVDEKNIAGCTYG